MFLTYQNKKSEADILEKTQSASLEVVAGQGHVNKLIKGDNLSVMKTLLGTHAGLIDLVYIDPPFATNATYKIGKGRTQTISNRNTDEIAYNDTLVGPDFLEFLRERLIFLRELMSDKGSIYLHIDYKVGHYVKLLMDEVFGVKNFRNDITRIKCNPKNFQRKGYGNIKDLILFYSKTNDPIWNHPTVAFNKEEKSRLFKKTDPNGRKYTTIPLHAPGETKNGNTGKEWRGVLPPQGRHWRSDPIVLEELDKRGLIEWSSKGVPRRKIFLDEKEGKKMQDIWEFKDPQYPQYPTEKSIDLLTHIVEASSDIESIVLDCFSGSGTTIVAAQKIGRCWIGIDQSNTAIEVAKKRIEEMGDEMSFEFLSQVELSEQPSNIKVSENYSVASMFNI
jgi:adenine-specific DNA-methyltransferase